MRRIMMTALGIGLLSVLCACGNVESEKNMVEAIPSESTGVVHIPSGRQGKMPAAIISHELGATLDRVKGCGETLAEEGYMTVCFDFCGGGWGSRSDGELPDMLVLTEKADLEAALEEVQQWDFELTVSYITDFLNNNENRKMEEVAR